MKRLITIVTLAAAFAAGAQDSSAALALLRGDYIAGTSAGDPATFAASGTGTWTYLSSDTANPTLDGNGLVTMVWNGIATWRDPSDPNAEPQVSLSPGATSALASDEVNVHPNDAAPQFGVMRWTAGAGEAGAINISGGVRDLNTGGGNGTSFEIFVDGVSMFNPGVITTTGGSTFSFGATIGVGSIVDFVVGPNGNSDFDSTAVSATIVPEPGRALLAFFGLAAACGRRKRG